MHCSETVKEKPGICPRVKVKCPSVPPKPNCKVDNDCHGKEKCCKRCAMTCVDPDEERPGFCPMSRERLSCITTLDETICNKDSDCPKNQKCCLNKDQNQMVCLPSLKEKPGSCPKKIGVCHLPIKPKCKGDSYCPGDKKCCAPGCIAQCMDPITGSDICNI
ncbi:hypothetical protein GDO86_018559 [Hymenochirus boettgeri]|uniref:WAP domain-containing protein n=1 Tax=Hymenochirus boettgeri TaxID=247094 RepID=A0A8T2IBW4_9PIPI|nr:hypothetical protein GDO86_018559 [Hymenochirus boettgeri]